IVERRTPDIGNDELLDGVSLRPGFFWTTESVGTKAIGMWHNHDITVHTDGDDHFMDALRGLSMASTPLHPPTSGNLLGVLTLVCSTPTADVLLTPVLQQ